VLSLERVEVEKGHINRIRFKDQIDFRGMSLMCRDHDVTDEFEFPHELEILFETRR